MEIYNERIKDLLASTDMHPDIVEDKKKGIYVRNLNEEIVKTPKEVMDCIQKGESNRHISATDYNDRSSRSHTIFQLVIESRQKSDESKTNSVQISQLNLIDLAGSEKVASDMERRKEGAFINKSLLTLGNVISKLTSDEPTTHIPFRNSKLTRILQASLSGNARISVICTINPTLASKDESLNTLKFAQRTKLVKTDAKMTKIGDNSQLQKCLRTIAELQIQMQEKNDIETETRNKLQNLLSIILTSSKESTRDHIDINFHSSTVDEVLAYCEENLLAKIESDRQTIQSMKVSIEQLQNKMRVMDDIVADKTEIVSRREVQIESLTEKQKVTIGHLKETANPALAHAFETFFLSTKPEEISQAKELIRQSLSKDGGQVFKEKRNESRELRLLSQKCKELVSENESLQKKMNKPVSIQEATLSVLPVFPMYRALVRQETLPELVEQVSEDCSSCHSTDDSFWDDRNDTESEVEEIVKTYEPYSQSIQQRVFYVPSSVIVAFIIYLLYQL
ncbi:hypothetical protein G6F56_009056 [Rhizopus delemar]|nr:hypothetical protein G6F56_009056 [Rhizopus delemar]